MVSSQRRLDKGVLGYTPPGECQTCPPQGVRCPSQLGGLRPLPIPWAGRGTRWVGLPIRLPIRFRVPWGSGATGSLGSRLCSSTLADCLIYFDDLPYLLCSYSAMHLLYFVDFPYLLCYKRSLMFDANCSDLPYSLCTYIPSYITLRQSDLRQS